MEGDLSLSQSLGGLRIANPDNTSSPSSQAESVDPSQPFSLSPFPPYSTQANGLSYQSNGQIPPISAEPSGRPLSVMDFDPSSYSTDKITLDMPSTPSPSLPKETQTQTQTQTHAQAQEAKVLTKQRSISLHKNNDRQPTALPQTYQAQQQAQFPQYPTMMPQAQRQHNLSARPMSTVQQQQQQPQPNKSPLPPRDSSYRLHRESSQISLNGTPKRSSSRAAMTAVQAGVPSREASYSDRSYRNPQVPSGNAPFPPRRSSKGLPAGAKSTLSGSPYEIEGGPAASSEEWQEKGAAVGLRNEIDANGRPVSRYVKKGVKDFHFGRTLGEGSYSTVILATDRQTLKEYAIKVLDKRHIIKEKKVKYVNIEKDTLNRLTDHPGVVKLYYTFQDERSLYFVLDFASGGELLGVLKRWTTFDEECTQFYCAQILDTVEYMHSKGVIHRDLKPENVLMDDKNHIKITDFGTAKILDAPARSRANSNGVPLSGDPMDGSEDGRAVSFVGTAEYVSPELLTEKNACKASDLWAFGCIIYQLLAGRPPFKAGNEYLTFQKIVALEYSFPRGFPPIAKDLIERLLVLDPARRLSIDHIKNHEFFDGIQWGRGLWEQKSPRFKNYSPPTNTIKLNGGNGEGNTGAGSYPVDMSPSRSTKPVHISGNGNGNTGSARSPRIITDLPPPSQLDIEWSPVLTRNNERIIHLGNLNVLSTPAATSPPGKGNAQSSDGNKFSRFFGGGNAAKKKLRLVMVTSTARIIIAAADSNEKKTKLEISLLESDCSWKKMQDSKGLSYWCIDTRDKHITFEDPKTSTSDGSATSAAAQEWLDSIDRAKELALMHSISNSSYSPEEAYSDLQSGMSSSANTLDMNAELRTENASAASSRHTLQKLPSSKDPEELKGFKRFSKRQSKSGLAAVF